MCRFESGSEQSSDQPVIPYLSEECCKGSSRFTQILRNRLEKTSIKSPSFFYLSFSLVELLNFWRGRCVIRGTREKSLPHAQSYQNVTMRQSRRSTYALSYFFLQLRKICVISPHSHFKSNSQIIVSRLQQRIMNPLRLILQMKMDILEVYGND